MTDQPTEAAASGRTLTFLFTDLEGSTRLERELGSERYAAIRDEHRRLLRAAFAAHRGRDMGTAGDSFFVVFEGAPQAVAAAIDGQKALARATWPDGLAVRVRMGLNSGVASISDQTFVGIAINRAARIEAAAHGGQIVISDATRTLLSDEPTAKLTVRDLGIHRLKDFEPMRLFQVVAEGLGQEFPPLRSLGGAGDNLPAQLTSFVGREREIAEVSALLGDARLVTLTGPGGTGKTRLSIAAAQAAAPAFPDGITWVPLSPIADPALVPAAVAFALGVRDQGTRSLPVAIVDALAGRKLLLLLDNFEQVLPAATLVADIVARAPATTVLVSSRSLLHLNGEREYPVPPLGVPDPDNLPALEALGRFESIALFVERAAAVRPGWVLTPELAPAVATICARLDGLPLAIELAAARVRLLSPAAIVARLQTVLPLLSGGARDLPERQQTLRGAIAWSYDLLEPVERTFFARLAVFAGGWSLEAAATVCDPDGTTGLDVLDAVVSLADKSLVREVATASGEPRFRMLQTIREFGEERLVADGELDAVRDRHLAAFSELVRAAEPELTGMESHDWLDRMELEHDNIRAALRWARESGALELGMATAGSLWRFWHQRAHLGEGSAMLRDLLVCPAASGRTPARAKALIGLAGLTYWQNDFEASGVAYEEALVIDREIGDRAGEAEVLYGLAFLTGVAGDFQGATAYYEGSRAIYRQIGDIRGEAWALIGLALVQNLAGESERARVTIERALELVRTVNDRYGLANGLSQLGRIRIDLGDLAGAVWPSAEALRLFRDTSDPSGVAMQLDNLGTLALQMDEPEQALRLAAAAIAIRGRIEGGAPISLIRSDEYAPIARARLDPAVADRAWAEGSALSLDEATDLALAMDTGELTANTSST